MFDRSASEGKFNQFMQQKTGTHFGETQDDSIVYQVEAERDYVNRLKTQRQKIEGLYSRYDVLLKDLKSKDFQIKEKEKTINNLESKCKNLSYACQESTVYKQENYDIKSENQNLQKAISELEESYAFLHGKFKSKESVSGQKFDEMENLNDQLMNKLRSLTKRYQQREQEFDGKYKNLVYNFEEFKTEAKKSKQELTNQREVLKAAVLQKDEEIKLMKTENQCLKSRISELECYINDIVLQHEEQVEQIQKEKKCQIRVLKNELESMKDISSSFERKWQKLRQECELKDFSLKEMHLMIEEHDKQNHEALFLLKNQFAQEKGILKEQLIQCENHIEKLERKIADLVRKEQCLYGKIKKYEVCMDAKRNLREVEQQELDKINHLLSFP